MIEGGLSRRYARALFELASEERREEQVGEEIDRFAAAYCEPSLSAALTNPAFPLASRKNVVVEVARGLELSLLALAGREEGAGGGACGLFRSVGGGDIGWVA